MLILPPMSFIQKFGPNPETGNIRDGVAACKEAGCTGVLAIGGGSAMDTAKGIAYMVNQSGQVEEYLDGRGSEKRALVGEILPILAVPTTAGTGSEVSLYAVITDEKTRIKDSLSEGRDLSEDRLDRSRFDGWPADEGNGLHRHGCLGSLHWKPFFRPLKIPWRTFTPLRL